MEAEQERVVQPFMPYSISTKEASTWSGIGINRLRSIMNDEDCPFVFFIGLRKRVRTEAFKEWLDAQPSV